MMIPLCGVLAAALAIITTPAVGAVQDPPTFRAEANLVVLHVNVFDKDGHPIDELAADNFLVYENEQAQTISFFNGEDVPVTVGLVLDNSSSMITRRHLVVAGAMAFAQSSHPEDELFTISFTENVKMGLPPSVKFTSSTSILQASLVSLRPGGKTALHDAVIRALDHIQQSAHQKRVLIVLSDGEDTASTQTERDMLERARASDVIIYTVGVVDRATGRVGNEGVLKDLARIGGGQAYFPERDSEIVTHFEKIAQSIRQGYSIGYTPPGGSRPGEYKRVKLMVRVPGRKGLTARYRHGYETTDTPNTGR